MFGERFRAVDYKVLTSMLKQIHVLNYHSVKVFWSPDNPRGKRDWSVL